MNKQNYQLSDLLLAITLFLALLANAAGRIPGI